MIAKILMCRCYVEKFHSEGNKYVKKLAHFQCKCKDQHVLYVLFCEQHPYQQTPILEEKKCTCATAPAKELYNFCIHVKYLLNFKCYKLCFERIPVGIQDKLITIFQYFEVMKSCEPFFYFNRERNMIFITLDYPLEPKIKVRTDYIYRS